ncbi:MAG: NAD(P)/FAD-dependent oxidoreductase [Candidatus Bipolaricaulaceae bacterium]
MRIAVIGAGVVGALIARELSRYEAEVLLFEREPEPGFGVSKANSAVVHAGFHEEPGTLRAKFCLLGNVLFPEVCAELAVPFRRSGALVLAFSAQEEKELRKLLEQGRTNGVPGLEILPREEVLAREPWVNPEVHKALWAPTAGITEPWSLAQAAAENAATNGAKLLLGQEITGIIVERGTVRAVRTANITYPVEAVVNAAGLYADRVTSMAGISCPPILPRRGQYVLLDKPPDGGLKTILFPVPTPSSKGVLVLPTLDGRILLGPTAEDLGPEEKGATETTRAGLSQVLAGAKRLVPRLPVTQALKNFAGLRPVPATGDFLVGPTPVRGFYQAAGMSSPGLTAAPAVARFLVHEVVAADLGLHQKSNFVPKRLPIPRVEDLAEEEWAELVRRDPRWGKIVCFCQNVTEAQVVEAIRRGARTLDGVKFRTRAGFGRCQGSFCTARILELLAEVLGLAPEEITLRGPGSALVAGRVRP